MESFFHSLKAELTHGRVFATVVELRQALRRYMRYYDHDRLHSALDYQSPVDYKGAAAWKLRCLLNRGKIPVHPVTAVACATATPVRPAGQRER